MEEGTVGTVSNNQIDILDDLISRLEFLITKADEEPLTISTSDKPKRSFYRPLGVLASSFDRKSKISEAIFLANDKLTLKCTKTELVKLMKVEVTILGGKNGHGEVSFIIAGVVSGMRRVRGGYEVDITIDESRRVQVTPGQKIRESVENNDVAGWNRWCQDIKDNLDLTGINLANANLTGYDLCCADLTDADLSGADLTNAMLAGADLSRTNLDAAKVVGADFFRSKINRGQAALLSQSGMPEKESVIFVD